MPGLDGVGRPDHGCAGAPSFDKRVLFANRWLFISADRERAGAFPSLTRQSIRTTTAPTMLSGGAGKTMPPRPPDGCSACIRATPEAVTERAPRGHDERVTIAMTRAGASAVAATDSAAYRAIQRAVRGVYGDTPYGARHHRWRHRQQALPGGGRTMPTGSTR